MAGAVRISRSEIHRLMGAKRVRLPGTASSTVILRSGEICVLCHAKSQEEVAICFDSDGSCLWRVDLAGLVAYSSVLGLGWAFRAAGHHASPWLGSSLKSTIQEIGPEAGRTVSVKSLLKPGEALASFLLLPDGFVVSTCQWQLDISIEPRVMRLDEKGQPRWVTDIRVDSEDVDSEDSDPWTIYFVGEPLIVAGDFVLAGYSSVRSGIGRWYCLNLESGAIHWHTELIPVHYAASMGLGRFLIGAQGYGAFETYLYDAVEGLKCEWTTHGYWVVRDNGEVRLVEMENRLPSRMHVSILELRGRVRQGPHLDGYATTYPFITSDGQLVFCRNGELCVVDERLKKHVLHREPSLSKLGSGRMLREPGGKLVFTVGDELWLVDAGIAEMAKSPWPCGSGNPGGNPVWPVDAYQTK